MSEHNPKQNHLLAALPAEVYSRLLPHLEFITLPLGKVLYESGDTLRHVYFPIDSIVSLLYVMKSGASAEISVVGNEGLIGVALFMGGGKHHEPCPGTKCRLCIPPERPFAEERVQSAWGHAASGLALHPGIADPDQQLCRWLLLSLDRLSGDKLCMTQELIANMLGVRREGVTDAACKLQKLGVIEYRRGHITVLDRPKLERLSCECFAVVKVETDRLLPYLTP
jgi:CRP-like cAMP-binding protein